MPEWLIPILSLLSKLIPGFGKKQPNSVSKQRQRSGDHSTAIQVQGDLNISASDTSPPKADETLSAEERELLIAAALSGGSLWVNEGSIPRGYHRVNANKTPSGISMDYGANDPEEAVKYIEALESLQARDYIRYEAGVSYRLSTSGWKRGRELNPE